MGAGRAMTGGGGQPAQTNRRRTAQSGFDRGISGRVSIHFEGRS